MPLAELNGLSKHFGGLMAVDKLDLAVQAGEIFGLIGPNGAGKTTVFNLITGFLKPSGGRVQLAGADITAHSPASIAAKGVVRTFQATILFKEETVLQNVIIGHSLSAKTGLVQDMFWSAAARAARRDMLESSLDLLQFLGIDHLKDELAKNLPHGYQRILGIAVALAPKPKLLLLDEPATGMNPEEARHLMQMIARIKERGMTIIIVEHDMKVVMGVCDRIAVLNFGRKIAEGAPGEIRRDKDVIAAYLGKKYVA